MKPELDFRYVQVWNVPPDVPSTALLIRPMRPIGAGFKLAIQVVKKTLQWHLAHVIFPSKRPF